MNRLFGRATTEAHSSWLVAIGRAARTVVGALAYRRDVVSEQTRYGADLEDRALWLREAAARLCQSMRVDVSMEGEPPRGPCVIVSNHMSYLDPLAIGRTLPLSAVAKSELLEWPTVGDALEDLGVVFVQRGSVMSGAIALRRASRILDAGLPVLVFPEGRTTFGDEVLPFSRGAFGIAQLKRVPVVPVALRYRSLDCCWVGDARFLPHFLKLHRLDEVSVELTFGPALDPSDFADVSLLRSTTEEWIRSRLFR
ncbi:MAG: lysophospholipid acyltransferase family protein [Polyangiales bacterium]